MSVVSPSGHLLAGYFLGFQKNNRMFIPPEKISGILEEVVEIMSCCSISARNLARVTGRIICKLVLDADVLLELKFCSEHLRSLKCRPIWRKTVLPSRIVYSDASAVGCATFISMNDKPVSHKNWDAIEMKQSSTCSLRSWRYCVGARLKFWRRSRVPKKGSRDEASQDREQ